MQWIHTCLTCIKQLKLEHCNTKGELFSHCAVKHSLQANVVASWSKSVTILYTLWTEARLQNINHFCNLQSCRAPTFQFWGIFFYHIKHFPNVCTWFQKCLLSVLERCPCFREYSYSKMTEKGQGPAPGVRIIDWGVHKERVDCKYNHKISLFPDFPPRFKFSLTISYVKGKWIKQNSQAY